MCYFLKPFKPTQELIQKMSYSGELWYAVFSANVRVIFLEKNKLGSNNSEMYNSARNVKKKFSGRWRFSAVAAVSPPFLRSSLINIIKATAIPKLTAVTHFLAEFLP